MTDNDLEICCFCKTPIDEFYDNSLYRLNWKAYCSLMCFYDEYELKKNNPVIPESSKPIKKKKPKRKNGRSKRK